MKRFSNILTRIYDPMAKNFHSIWAVLLPKSYAKYYYRIVTGKKLNLKNPQNYNEKVQWLKIYSDTSQWTDLADKYKVREYVKQCGLSYNLVKLYGVWRKADDIDFSLLPDKFVLKTNNGCGKNILVYDKSQLNIKQTKILFNNWLREQNGLISFQPHMWNIDKRIIAEELLQDNYNEALSSSIVDYKFFCFNGEPEVIDVLFDRKNETVGAHIKDGNIYRREKVYDLNWNLRMDVLAAGIPVDPPREIPKPKLLNEMIKICRILSKPFPQVRVDLYEVNNRIYFGELTFTPGGMNDFTQEYLLKLGDKIDLSSVKRRTKLFII